MINRTLSNSIKILLAASVSLVLTGCGSDSDEAGRTLDPPGLSTGTDVSTDTDTGDSTGLGTGSLSGDVPAQFTLFGGPSTGDADGILPLLSEAQAWRQQLSVPPQSQDAATLRRQHEKRFDQVRLEMARSLRNEPARILEALLSTGQGGMMVRMILFGNVSSNHRGGFHTFDREQDSIRHELLSLVSSLNRERDGRTFALFSAAFNAAIAQELGARGEAEAAGQFSSKLASAFVKDVKKFPGVNTLTTILQLGGTTTEDIERKTRPILDLMQRTHYHINQDPAASAQMERAAYEADIYRNGSTGLAEYGEDHPRQPYGPTYP